MSRASSTLLPFLYPCFDCQGVCISTTVRRALNQYRLRKPHSTLSTAHGPESTEQHAASSHLNPAPDDYARSVFTDKCQLKLAAGSGGHGCISFLREKFIADGPANGGDGGSGGNIFIQAIRGETSLHKLARRGIIKAGRGKNGQGKAKGGQRGEDVLLQVPVGTVVREITRRDPVAEEEQQRRDNASEDEVRGQWRRDKWILYPSSTPSDYAMAEFPDLQRSRKSGVALSQVPAPINLDLSQPTEAPILLAAGAVGGLGNPHFVSKTFPKPKFATKGDPGMTVTVELELKLLADVGFVGLPNAGKSTLLRAMSRSRARVGSWAFTTLQPNIGTVVLDNHQGRPHLSASRATGEPRTYFSVADIPGLIPDAHKDRGLGLGFLRHVERAQVLAFVVDLGAGDAVEALKNLWRELAAFESLRSMETNVRTESRIVDWKAFGSSISSASAKDAAVANNKESGFVINPPASQHLPDLLYKPISTKPWFVVATKADLEGTQDNFARLQEYLQAIMAGDEAHPSGLENSWLGKLTTIPVSAIRGEGIERIPEWTVSLLDD
ncbi:MAG: hypothetical protein L6R38_000732 [Xanthoria sp. 2 TBL-2021]|nr:MAG: hypothetical protein L6R38_000732 [Xanthoria sp. 2 TBL-2021]